MVKHTPDETLSWRGTLYRAGVSANIPDDLAAALGLAAPDDVTQGEPAPPHPPRLAIPEALKLINGVDVVREIQAIPTIGAGAAKRILESRPNGGYASLEAVWEANPELLSNPYRTDPEAVLAWGQA